MKYLAILLLLLATSLHRIPASPRSPNQPGENQPILMVNNLTYTVAYEHDGFYSFIGVRALAMVHLAIHDLLAAAYGKYEPYHWKGRVKPQEALPASVEAARIILRETYPARRDTIDRVCAGLQQKMADGKNSRTGKKMGAKVARIYLKLRAQDGHKKEGEYTPMTEPGDYQYTPGNGHWVLHPDFGVAHPFTLDRVTQFRSPPPPVLDSEAYTRSYGEVKAYGARNSVVRSEDQTHYAHWWAEFGEHSWNRIGRISANDRGLPLLETNRMFALINMNLYDLYLAALESKYHYDTWRPYTAIRHGDQDHNPATISDPDWLPEMKTPPWPEYPSAHAAVGAAGATLLTEVYGTPEVHFTMESVTALPGSKTRTYTNLNQAAKDCADSRIMNGFHFRFAIEAGMRQGREIARHTVDNFLRPLAPQGDR